MRAVRDTWGRSVCVLISGRELLAGLPPLADLAGVITQSSEPPDYDTVWSACPGSIKVDNVCLFLINIPWRFVQFAYFMRWKIIKMGVEKYHFTDEFWSTCLWIGEEGVVGKSWLPSYDPNDLLNRIKNCLPQTGDRNFQKSHIVIWSDFSVTYFIQSSPVIHPSNQSGDNSILSSLCWHFFDTIFAPILPPGGEQENVIE